jgi:hypothetical protein
MFRVGMHWISPHWILPPGEQITDDITSSFPPESYKYPPFLMLSDHSPQLYRSWVTITRNLPLMYSQLPLCVQGRSSITNQVLTHSGCSLPANRLLPSLEAHHLPSTASQKSTTKRKKKTITLVEREGHLSAYLHPQLPHPSNLFPNQYMPTLFSLRPRQAFFRHNPQEDLPLNPIPLIFASFTTIPSTHLVGMSTLYAAPNTAGSHQMRHT